MKFFPQLVDAADNLMRIYMRLQSRISPLREGETFFGAKITCDIRDFIQRRIYFFSNYEPNLTRFVIDTVKPGTTFLDLGANIGYFSLLASRVVGTNGKVISIEASPSTHRTLKANLDRNGCSNVDARNVAVTETPTRVEIRSVEAGNIGANAITTASSGHGVQVDGLPLMTILGSDAGQVRFIKIDIEGSEGPVLEDLLENIDQFPPDLVIVAEVSPRNASFVRRFRDAGFRVRGLPNNYRIGYLMVRSYLARTGEDRYVYAAPADDYADNYTDYIFDRRAARA